MHMSNLAVKAKAAWPDAVKSRDIAVDEMSPVARQSKHKGDTDRFAFADIYLRNAPCYFKGLMLQARGENVKASMRKSDAGVLVFEKGACEISASSMFLTVAMSATDEQSLADMQSYFDDKLRAMSPQSGVEIDWRHK